MKNLRKIMAVALVTLMCMSLMPVRGLAATDDKVYPPVTPINFCQCSCTLCTIKSMHQENE